MQVDRGDRLWKFITVSIAIHICLLAYSRHFRTEVRPPEGGELEVVLTPSEPAKKEAKAEQKPEEKKKQAAPQTQRIARNQPSSSKETPKASREPKDTFDKQVVSTAKRSTLQSSARASAPSVSSGRKLAPASIEPMTANARSGKTSVAMRSPAPSAPSNAGAPSDRSEEPSARNSLAEERAVRSARSGGPEGAAAPRFARADRTTPLAGGAGEPAGGPTPRSGGGTPGPEAAPTRIKYNDGGSGGNKVIADARPGLPGGASILSVNNPLSSESAPSDSPGFGAGAGGGGKGNRAAVASLRTAPSEGVGMGAGRGVGIGASRGGRGVNPDQPGSGGSGVQYGRGGSGAGVGGRSVIASNLGVDNPLGLAALPSDTPGVGIGVGNGRGTRVALANVRGVSGPGVGLGRGSGVGNGRRVGSAAGAETPGAGGNGVGYGRKGLGAGGGGRSVLAKGLIGDNPFGTDVMPSDRPGAGHAVYGGGKGSGVTVAGLRSGLGYGYGPGNGRGTGVRNTGRGNGMGSDRPGPGAGYGRSGVGTGGGRGRMQVASIGGSNPLGGALPGDSPGAGAGVGGGRGTQAGLGNQRGIGTGNVPGFGPGSGTRGAGRGSGKGPDRPSGNGSGIAGIGRGDGPGLGTGGKGRAIARGSGGDNPLGNIGDGDEKAGPGDVPGPGGGAERGNAIASLRQIPGNGLGGSGEGSSPRGNSRTPGLGGEKPGPGGSGTGEGSSIGRAAVAAVTGPRRAQPRTADLNQDDGERFRFTGLPPRGTPFKEGKDADFDGPLNIVYALDISGSMNYKSKMTRAKRSLKNAILELQPQDTFNIITFNANIGQYSSSMVKATEANIERAIKFIDDLHTEDGTDFGAGLAKALAMDSVSHIFLLTDGEPNRGITDDQQLREYVKGKNTQRAQILSVAIGQFKGWDLLKGLSADNGGIFQSIRLN